jgi:hypothetical protein
MMGLDKGREGGKSCCDHPPCTSLRPCAAARGEETMIGNGGEMHLSVILPVGEKAVESEEERASMG